MILIVLRTLWMMFPGMPACLFFWAVTYLVVISHILKEKIFVLQGCLWAAVIGLSCNAIATIGNNGRMPVTGPMSHYAKGMWVTANEETRFLFFADRFAGWSVGDFIIIGALLTYASVKVGRWLCVKYGW